ncbi:Uncharacterised protein [Collinsella aerofaciens]|nr:Uncharacterised protein [Collinsella aerofaciens]
MVALRREGAGGLEGLAAARDPRQGVRHAQGGPRDHRGVALVGLGLAGEQARGAAGGEPGQVGDPEPRGAGPPHGEGPYVAELVDDDERAGGRGGEQRVELGLPVADGGAGQHLPVAVDQAGPVRRLADVQAEHGRGSGGWRFHGGILPVVVRPDGLPLGTHITSRGACPALSYQPSGAARPAPAAPNRPSRGQGRSAVRGRPVGGPFWARLNRSPRRSRADNFDCNGRSCLTSHLRTSPRTTLETPQVEHKSAKTPLSEQGDVKEEGSVLWVRDRRLNVRLPLRGVCSVEPLRGLVKPRNPKALIHSNGGSQQYRS